MLSTTALIQNIDILRLVGIELQLLAKAQLKHEYIEYLYVGTCTYVTQVTNDGVQSCLM